MPDTPSIPHPIIRRLWPHDGPAVEAYLLRLDPETRASRFMGGSATPPPSLMPAARCARRD